MSSVAAVINLRDGIIAEYPSAKEAENACATGSVELVSGLTYFIATIHKAFIPEIKFSLKDITADMLKVEAKQAAKIAISADLQASDIEATKTEEQQIKRKRGPNKPKVAIVDDLSTIEKEEMEETSDQELDDSEITTTVENIPDETITTSEKPLEETTEEDLYVPPNFMDLETDLDNLQEENPDIFFN